MFDETFRVCFADTPFGVALHQRLRYQVFCLDKGFEDPEAFSTAQETDAWDDHSAHFIVQNKSTRQWVAATRLVLPKRGLSLPVDHLMMQLQALDEAGGALMDLRGFNNTINHCLRSLFYYAKTLQEDPIRRLHQYFSGRGVDYLACVHLYIFRLCFSLAAQFWFHLAAMYAESPCDLLELVSPNGTESSRARAAG